ncbi:MAG: hypothetical protein FWC20_09535 [Oscillospiraceae bacterium]|nr:hypothetical protein [Oscillospiraceae bacterium]MCL2279631.1 hypothetical protein [Oscillospiraceae bacterium]
MNIIGFTRTNWNIFDLKEKGTDLSSKINSAPQRVTPDASRAMTNKADISDFMSRGARESNNRIITAQREEFYTRATSLQGFTPGEFGNLSVEDEIRRATETGFAAVIDGKLTPSFSVGWTTDPNSELTATTNSPLDFAQKVDNLRSLFDHLGDNAVNYKTQFENALYGIIDDLFARGGMFINADREGVAESIFAMFNGTEGKYSADDLKTMAVLAFEAVGGGVTDSEVQLGMRLGMDAMKIQMARDSGRLSDAAYETVRNAFTANADDLIRQMNDFLDAARVDNTMPRNVAYSPARPELVNRAIDVMLGVLENADFNQGLREALSTLENMHNAQRENGLENGMADQRFNMQFMTERDRVSVGGNMQMGSQFFAEFLGRNDWAVNGNPFSVSVSA